MVEVKRLTLSEASYLDRIIMYSKSEINIRDMHNGTRTNQIELEFVFQPLEEISSKGFMQGITKEETLNLFNEFVERIKKSSFWSEEDQKELQLIESSGILK